MASLKDLPGVGEQLLSQFAAQLDAQGVPLPERRYRTPASMIAWDGEQLTVSLMGVEQGQPGGQVQFSLVPQTVVFYASYAINLIREVPVINTEGFASMETPTAEAQDRAGVELLEDAQALVLAGSEIHKAYSLTGPGEGFVIGPLTPVGPEGGLAGSRLLVSLSLS